MTKQKSVYKPLKYNKWYWLTSVDQPELGWWCYDTKLILATVNCGGEPYKKRPPGYCGKLYTVDLSNSSGERYEVGSETLEDAAYNTLSEARQATIYVLRDIFDNALSKVS